MLFSLVNLAILNALLPSEQGQLQKVHLYYIKKGQEKSMLAAPMLFSGIGVPSLSSLWVQKM